MSKKSQPRRLSKAQPSTAIAVVDATQAVAPVVQRASMTDRLLEIARDPSVDVAKINALIDANERVMAISAKQQFDEAFSLMQAELPVITKNGLAVVKKEQRLIRQTPYARDVDIALAVRPILGKYGFSIRHRNIMENGKLTVVGILAHRAGHREEDTFGPVAADDTGSKNAMQAWASARSYGKRYTTISLLNISSEDVRDGEDDGQAAGEVVKDEEIQPRSERRPVPQQARVPGPADEQPITRGTKNRPGQLERLWVIIRNSGRSEQVLKDWLHDRYGYSSTREIKRKHYDEICRAIEAKGPLPAAREPGEEG